MAVVEKLKVAPSIRRGKGDYFLQLTLPWDVLGIEPKPGLSLPMELGVFYSDPTGHKTTSREYWHSRISGMVSDVPTEARPTPDWGAMVADAKRYIFDRPELALYPGTAILITVLALNLAGDGLLDVLGQRDRRLG